MFAAIIANPATQRQRDALGGDARNTAPGAQQFGHLLQTEQIGGTRVNITQFSDFVSPTRLIGG